MAVPLLDLKRQYIKIKDRIDQAVLDVFDKGYFILGPPVDKLEKRIAELCRVKYGIGVASGTDALLVSLRAAGVGPGDEVITSDYSFFASASVISRAGAVPVFVDVEKDTYNIDPSKIEKAITCRTKAIIPVHLFGQVADMDPIMKIARKHKLVVIEDAAQAIGAEYKGNPAGSIGDFGCFSFYPSKNLGAAGDGGMIVTKTEANRDMAKMYRLHGWKVKYRPEVIGYNSRLDSLQAAVLDVKLDYLREWSEARIANAKKYDAAFAGTTIKIPVVRDFSYHIYNQYTIAVENREDLLKALTEKQIGHDIYYPVPFHLLACYKDLPYKKGDFPISEWAADHVVSIPIYPELTAKEQEEVIEVVKSASA
ncbi:MAG: transcriptional regulator [candidate division Zixibacteria bacterium HGW-Zixibacteria-1]|nr:MAG: transcriptional regulator [candidate division Zixibacteria bacterium HGW-Zixibacteria-1]